jgi:hypothetical protein
MIKFIITGRHMRDETQEIFCYNISMARDWSKHYDRLGSSGSTFKARTSTSIRKFSRARSLRWLGLVSTQALRSSGSTGWTT